jgi:hypothetical protein
MDHYVTWCDLRPGVKDLDFADAIKALLDRLQADGQVASWSLQRRKLGFGPRELGDFAVDIRTESLAQLEQAWDAMTPRSGELERLHAAVWSKVVNLKTALYREFPDANRVR